MTILQAILITVIEGLTEFLPVSSTGHMIIGSTLMGIAADDFVKLFTVAIQFGAILSVVVLYWATALRRRPIATRTPRSSSRAALVLSCATSIRPRVQGTRWRSATTVAKSLATP